MKIGLLCRNATLYSHRRLVEAAQVRGHDIHVIDHLRCYIDIASNDPEIHYQGESLKGYDAIIPRIGASVTFFGTAVLRQFEMMGVYPVNESVGISPLPRQAAQHAIVVAPGRRSAGHGLRPPHIRCQ